MLTTVLLTAALALTPAESFNLGNVLYQGGDYAGAADRYQQALQAGPNPDALYNLGNAQFKLGQVGRAVISYQRARFLKPRDGDIAANLAFLRGYRADKVLALPGPFEQLVDRTFHFLSIREAMLLAAACFFLAALLSSLFIVFRRRTLLYPAVPLFLLFAYGAATALTWHGFVRSRPAVVIATEVSALSGPGEDYKQILLAHDGSECLVREARGEWLLVQLPGGAGGWIRKGTVEMVFP
jgi:tetratricopeptide (TPR) repeat protein